jgi:hypothetical protein
LHDHGRPPEREFPPYLVHHVDLAHVLAACHVFQRDCAAPPFAAGDDPARAVHVDGRGIVEALDRVYEAAGLLKELGR